MKNTSEQQHRLSSFASAALVDALSVLNSSANQQMLDDWKDRSNRSQCIRCAVVGNGGILKDSKKGEEIDAHHYVFRTNGAITEGFQQDVGSRTTHYTFSTNTLMNSLRSYRGAGFQGPPMSQVSAAAGNRAPRVASLTPPTPPPPKQETRYIFLPDHDRDYLLARAAATRTPVERGPERAKK